MLYNLKELNNLINFGATTKSKKITNCFFTSIVNKDYKKQQSIHNKKTTIKITVQLEEYQATNKYVVQAKNIINKYLKDDLICAVIHGSLGTDEETHYSDFDALIIIKDEVFFKKKRLTYVVKKLFKIKKIMLQYDPLQHHGWFVMTESNLKEYPQLYFPVELFSYSKSLLSNSNSFTVNMLPKYTYLLPFSQLSRNIIQQAQSHYRIDNIYKLKSFLSEFMLLPTFYYQAKHSKAIYKKYSFTEVEKDVPTEIWNIMNEVSYIRETWNYDISWIKRKIIQRGCFLSHYFAKKYSPQIPYKIKKHLNDDFYKRVIELTNYLDNQLKEVA